MTEHIDMSQFIAANSAQMNADDLMDAPRTITITKVTATPDSAEQPVSIHFEGDGGKVFRPCKTVRRIMVGVWGKDASQYVGRSMTLYRDPTVAFGGMQVGGIRVSHMSHMDGEKTVALMVTRGRKAPFKVLPLATKVQPADDLAVALKAITDAAEDGLDALANVWKQKWMAPHREALQLDLDRLKLIAEAKGKPAETPRAEGNAPASGGTAQSSDADTSTGNGETTSSSGPTATTAASPSDDHPGKAIADRIIAEIEDAAAILDVGTILTAHDLDIASMLNEDAVRIEVAADKRRNAIRASREKAGTKEAAE